MKLTIFNGSPRVKGSNTRILIKHFTNGFTETEGNSFDIEYLGKINNLSEHTEAFANAEVVLFAFPLYVDSVPALVKRFIEALEPYKGRDNNPRIVFLVQSGFPEAHHSRFVERYLEKLARRLNCEYIGTIVRGAVEGIQAQPEKMTEKMTRQFYEIGKHFGETGMLDENQLQRLAKPEKYNPVFITLICPVFFAMSKYMFWNRQLKKNGVYDKRFAKPYAE